jgi:hypothetical protein
MAIGCLFAAFPTVTCVLVGLAYQLLGLDVIGPLGAALLLAALAAAFAIARQVWRHPEGFRPPGHDDSA